MVATAPRWRMKGEYFENCNCEVLCPCLHSELKARPTQGHCDALLAFNIQQGNYGNVRLNNLSYILALQTPGPMGEGKAKLALYIDQQANPRQREALDAIVSGKAGGPPAAMGQFIQVTEVLGVKYVPITFSVEGDQRHLQVPGVMTMNVEGLAGAPRGAVMSLTNVPHPASTTLAIARGTHTVYKDYGWDWNNTGKNGHYAPFDWSGP